jgi:hypothetical protein
MCGADQRSPRIFVGRTLVLLEVGEERVMPPLQVPTGWTREITQRVQADVSTVFYLLANVEFWPALFQHVRSARVLRRDGQRRLVSVHATWHGLPLGYTAVQVVYPEDGQMTIRHVSPLTRGSVAVWTVIPVDCPSRPNRAIDLSVRQQVIVPVPIVGSALARGFIGGLVARDLGQAMLDRLKAVAEGGSLAERR